MHDKHPLLLENKIQILPISESPDTGLEHPVSVSGVNMTDDCLVSFARKKHNPLFQTTQESLQCVKEDILQDTLHPGKQKQFKVFYKVVSKH